MGERATINDAPGSRRVLVAYGSKHGATAEIALAVTQVLRERGFEVDLAPAAKAPQPTPYAALVIGSAVYAGMWRGEVVDYLRRHRASIGSRPLWMFSSGPVDRSADDGELPIPPAIGKLAPDLHPRDHVWFGGRFLGTEDGLIESFMALNKSLRGDFRDFDRVREWATTIADGLAAEEVGPGA
ncbi:MAG TPA: flavodoxin domain-containing protein [Candidatus Dormibacteraeota bacterium]|nr:flavodoxin domain-containing protein [Candidatus Dormibacteraeota bacterium]